MLMCANLLNNTHTIFIINGPLLVSHFLMVMSRVLQVFRIFSKSLTLVVALIVLNIVSRPYQPIFFHMIYSVDTLIMLTQPCHTFLTVLDILAHLLSNDIELNPGSNIYKMELYPSVTGISIP